MRRGKGEAGRDEPGKGTRGGKKKRPTSNFREAGEKERKPKLVTVANGPLLTDGG